MTSRPPRSSSRRTRGRCRSTIPRPPGPALRIPEDPTRALVPPDRHRPGGAGPQAGAARGAQRRGAAAGHRRAAGPGAAAAGPSPRAVRGRPAGAGRGAELGDRACRAVHWRTTQIADHCPATSQCRQRDTRWVHDGTGHLRLCLVACPDEVSGGDVAGATPARGTARPRTNFIAASRPTLQPMEGSAVASHRAPARALVLLAAAFIAATPLASGLTAVRAACARAGRRPRVPGLPGHPVLRGRLQLRCVARDRRARELQGRP